MTDRLTTDLTISELKTMACTMNLLPFVMWDRFIDVPAEADIAEGSVDVYGWIRRPGHGYKDFVLLTFPKPITLGHCGYTTSSALFSKDIGRLLHMEPVEIPCQRVDEVFGELVECKTSL